MKKSQNKVTSQAKENSHFKKDKEFNENDSLFLLEYKREYRSMLIQIGIWGGVILLLFILNIIF